MCGCPYSLRGADLSPPPQVLPGSPTITALGMLCPRGAVQGGGLPHINWFLQFLCAKSSRSQTGFVPVYLPEEGKRIIMITVRLAS